MKSVGMKERLFRFKRFSVAHSRSAMKVGVDGVLTALWAQMPPDSPASPLVLDAGCGCGVISLILAQRFPDARIVGADTDAEAAAEAAFNFAASPWSSRLEAVCRDWREAVTAPVDLIVSNPPFFYSGADPSESARSAARHAGSLSPVRLVELASSMLSPQGSVCTISTPDSLDAMLKGAADAGMTLRRLCHVCNHPGAAVKRILTGWSRESGRLIEDSLTLFGHDRTEPTEAYRALGKDFYLKF